MRGALLLDAGDADRVEDSFRQAIQIAEAQSARTLGVRAGVSLGRLLCKRGDGHAARALVAERCKWFDEGHETPDLQEAGALLTTE